MTQTTQPTKAQLDTANSLLAKGYAWQAGFGPRIESWDDDRFLYLLSNPSDPDSFVAVDPTGAVVR